MRGDFEAQWSEAFDLLRTGRGCMKSLPSKLQRWARKERMERKEGGNA